MKFIKPALNKIWTQKYEIKAKLTSKVCQGNQMIQHQFLLQFIPFYSLFHHCGFPPDSSMKYCKYNVWSPPVVCLQEVEAWSAWQLGPWAWSGRRLCGAHPRRVMEWFLLWRSHKLHLWEGNGDLYVYFCCSKCQMFPSCSFSILRMISSEVS